MSLTYVSLATIMTAPLPEHVLLAQWKTSFLRGFHLCPTSSFFAGGCLLINALLTYFLAEGNQWGRIRTLLLSAAFILSLVPYTLSIIVPLEKVLLKKEAQYRTKPRAEKDEGGNATSLVETKALLVKFGKLNYVRTLLPLLGAVTAWFAW